MAKGIKSGGRRPGSKNKSKDEIKELIDANVDFAQIVGKLVELSMGVKTLKQTQAGPIVYDEKPDTSAAKLLLEYRFGRPLQQIAHSGEITEVVITKHIVPKRA